MLDGVKSSGSKRITNSFIKGHAMKGIKVMGKTFQKGKNPNNFKAPVSNPKGILSRRGLF